MLWQYNWDFESAKKFLDMVETFHLKVFSFLFLFFKLILEFVQLELMKAKYDISKFAVNKEY